jgi:uncharacterized protein YndB with AHSA1/START domain
MASEGFIKVEATIAAPVEKVWELWTGPEHVTQWNFAAPEWHAPYAENDLQPNGRFKYTMAARDGSTSFDFEGTYTEVKEYKLIKYTLDDDRTVELTFEAQGDQTKVTELFEPETQNPREMQQGGWQAILNNFKAYAEGK